MDSRKFYSFLIAFFAGVAAASIFSISPSFVFICLIIAAVLISQKKFFYLAILLFFALGAGRFEISKTNIHPLDENLGQTISVEGYVSSEPLIKELKQRFYLKSPDYDDEMIVSLPPYPSFEYGGRLLASGILKLPENFETFPGGPVFDYVSYLSKDGVRYILDKPTAAALGENDGNPLVALLIKLKKSFMRNIEESMPEPHSSLVAGILLGEKSSLPAVLVDDFRHAGLTHILVLSGSNVSIVAGSLMSLFSFLPRAIGQSLGAFSIILFALMTGASATTVRASMMALVVIVSKRAGRDYDVSRALLLAAFLMVMQNPAILAFDIGFQLSFISTLALIYVCPIVSARLGLITERFGLRSMISMTVSTQIFILPFMLYKMGEVSVISLFTNILVLPIVPWSMLLGFLTGIFGYFGRIISMPFALLTDVLLSWMIKVVTFFGGLSVSTVKVSLSEVPVIFIYILFACLIWRWHLKNSSPQSAN